MRKFKLAVLFGCSILLTSCNRPEYIKDFTSIHSSDTFSQIENSYAIFLGSDSCPNCKEVGPSLATLNKSLTENNSIQNIYYVNRDELNFKYKHLTTSDVSLSDGESIRDYATERSKEATNPEDIYYVGVPTVFKIVNKRIIDVYIGSKSVGNFATLELTKS